MTAIFVWLLHQALPFLIDLAVKYGLPSVAQWVMKKWPFIPKSIVDGVMKIINDAVAAIEGVTPSDPIHVAARAEATQKARDCVGAACMVDTKGLD